MESKSKSTLNLEALEARRLLSAVWKGSDIDGDQVTIRLRGEGLLDVQTSEVGLGEQIDAITVWDSNEKSRLDIMARKTGGDGYVDVGEIDAGGEMLRQITVDGNLGDLDVAVLAKLKVFSSETFGGETAQWFIGSDLKQLALRGHLENAVVEVAGDLRKASVRGDIYEASLLVDGQLRSLSVRGDIANDSLVSVLGDVGAIGVRGFVDYSTIETGGELRKLVVGADVLDSDIFASTSIGRLVVKRGAIDNSLIESSGYIRSIKSWDWIVDSDLVAGPEGIGTIRAYNLVNTSIETAGGVDRLLLNV